ncbi:endolytic transglycosylase MltG [Streptomyces telluris]|uniref:Endolytic murein transglycosylase n=1 Tax=Streptomyces telluris TaxID=2720021 RepID=A0A9X2RQ70_9ACTN|nr:endolytic transglycosylase MltG [Streptomyces telluris]MCQ8772186.1 endolytic transglycosylase MltG [Streptomyces telluris]NJP77403.1 endolytic transglycosylase MltG [Streptomyces telluris]
MTEYGRGSGSQPWHPDDPLYGDQGYSGQQQHPQQSQQPQYGHGQQQYGWDPSQGGQSQGGQQQYGQPQGGGTYGGGQGDYYGTPGGYQQPQPQHPQHQHPQQPHGRQPHAQPGHQQPQVPEQQAHQAPQQPQHQGYQPQQEWSEPDEEKISLFDDLPPATGRPGDRDGEPAADDEAEDDEPREERSRSRDRRGKGKKPKKNKRRSGTACLVVAVALIGVVGGGGYFAYDYWQTHFAAAPDYEGQGSGEVRVEIPKDSSLTAMGRVLHEAGVVKSVGAFTEAAGKNPKGKAIQAGTYTLRKEMSGAAAVEMMTNAANFLTIAEGRRAVQVYAAIDEKLGLAAGTTEGVAKNQAKSLGLPAWANTDPKIKDPLEGFLFPSQYSAGKGTKPETILKQMVARANENYAKQDLEGKARELGLKSPLQLITVASLVNAEGMTHDDFRKMARVIYNRLKPTNTETNGKLEFDSTYNYVKNQSKLDLSPKQIRALDHPYNTYFYKGLPPGPIGNPGEQALKAAMDPEPGDWYYFVSIKEKTTFTKNLQEHQKLVDEFNKSRKSQ